MLGKTFRKVSRELHHIQAVEYGADQYGDISCRNVLFETALFLSQDNEPLYGQPVAFKVVDDYLPRLFLDLGGPLVLPAGHHHVDLRVPGVLL